MNATKYPHHPGTINIVDGTTNAPIKTLDAGSLPKAFKFQQTERGYEAIATIMRFASDRGTAWKFFSEGGRLVRTGTGTSLS